MKAGTRVAAYAAGPVTAFGGAFGIANAAVPDSVVVAWADGSNHMRNHDMSAMGASDTVKGVSLSADELVLSRVHAPTTVGEPGRLSYRIEDATGKPVTTFAATHEKDMHLIVVRSDGSDFRHVHPTLDETTGTWSLPWTWDAAGTYRVYADFASGSGTAATLSRTVQVAGDYQPVDPQPTRVSQVDGYTVSLEGDLATGTAGELKLTVAKDGAPVTALQPYLGAFGHLVALRQGDLAFLHVHPEGAEPTAGATGGPAITFATAVPTAGRYLLYLDFQVDGQVHTASFVVDAVHGHASQADKHPHGGH